MKFRDIQLLNSGKYSEEKLEQNKYLMFYWENIRNIFCLEIPNGFEFFGISKLNIQFCEIENGVFIEPDNSGIAVFKRNDFSFASFCKLSEEEKDRISLDYMEDTLIEVCDLHRENHGEKKAIREICNIVRESGFEAEVIHKKTTKWHPSRKIRAVTKLYFKKGGVDTVIELVNKEAERISRQTVIKSGMWESVWSNMWKGSWREDVFVVENRFGEIFHEIEYSSGKAI